VGRDDRDSPAQQEGKGEAQVKNIRLAGIAKTRDLEIAAATNDKGSSRDRRRYGNRARIVASYIEAAEELGGNQTLAGQEHLIRAGRVAREGEQL
jgi:hypothetical protein